MAYQNIDSKNLGNTVTIMFSEGIRQNLSLDYPEFEQVQSLKAQETAPRQIEYMVQTSLGPSSVQYGNPGARGAFPNEQQTEQTEAVAKLKELRTTISFDYNLFQRLLKTKEKYAADRLKIEVESKNVATRRQICQDFYGDGTGVLGTISSVSVTSGRAVVTLSQASTARGFSGSMQLGELVIHKDTDGTAGTAATMSSGTFSYWKVVARDMKMSANTVTLQAYDADGNALTTSAWTPAAGEVFYKKDQLTFPDLSSISDYGTVSNVIAGLGALVADDGRTVNGLDMEGALASTIIDLAGEAIDVTALEDLMNGVKNNVGAGRYKWPKAIMNRYVRSAFIESRETDRRFVSHTDVTRGVQKFCYEHDGDSIELVGREFCPYQSIYVLPEGKIEGHKVIEYHGLDFDAVKTPGGDTWHLSPSGNSYQDLMLMFLFGAGVLTNNHPAACGKITNFTVP